MVLVFTFQKIQQFMSEYIIFEKVKPGRDESFHDS